MGNKIFQLMESIDVYSLDDETGFLRYSFDSFEPQFDGEHPTPPSITFSGIVNASLVLGEYRFKDKSVKILRMEANGTEGIWLKLSKGQVELGLFNSFYYRKKDGALLITDEDGLVIGGGTMPHDFIEFIMQTQENVRWD